MKVKVSTKKYDMKHVYYYSLPIGAMFLHKGEFYVKTGKRPARKWSAAKWDDSELNETGFDGHEGCIISEQQFKIFNLTKRNIRSCR